MIVKLQNNDTTCCFTRTIGIALEYVSNALEYVSNLYLDLAFCPPIYTNRLRVSFQQSVNAALIMFKI